VIAAFLTAIYPYYVVHDTALQETSLDTFLTALSVLLSMRVRESASILLAACAGLTLGTAVLTRANLAPFALDAIPATASLGRYLFDRPLRGMSVQN
jgi:hypothetical protein